MSGETLKPEEDTLRRIENDLARDLGRMIRKRKGLSMHRLGQIFYPRALNIRKAEDTSEERRGVRGTFRRFGTRAKQAAQKARRQLLGASFTRTPI